MSGQFGLNKRTSRHLEDCRIGNSQGAFFLKPAFVLAVFLEDWFSLSE